MKPRTQQIKTHIQQMYKKAKDETTTTKQMKRTHTITKWTTQLKQRQQHTQMENAYTQQINETKQNMAQQQQHKQIQHTHTTNK